MFLKCLKVHFKSQNGSLWKVLHYNVITQYEAKKECSSWGLTYSSIELPTLTAALGSGLGLGGGVSSFKHSQSADQISVCLDWDTFQTSRSPSGHHEVLYRLSGSGSGSVGPLDPPSAISPSPSRSGLWTLWPSSVCSSPGGGLPCWLSAGFLWLLLGVRCCGGRAVWWAPRRSSSLWLRAGVHQKGRGQEEQAGSLCL